MIQFDCLFFFLFRGKHFIYRHTFSCAYLDRLAQGSPTRQCFRRWWCRWESRVRPRHNRARSCTGLGPPQRSARCRLAPLWAGRQGFRRTCYGALYEGEKEWRGQGWKSCSVNKCEVFKSEIWNLCFEQNQLCLLSEQGDALFSLFNRLCQAENFW